MVTALCLGIGLPGMVLSWRFRMPVVLAWSTPGAALLAASTLGLGWSNAIGAFVFAAVLMVLTGLLPALGRLAQRIPASVASAMLAGVLLPFVLRLFKVAPDEMGLGRSDLSRCSSIFKTVVARPGPCPPCWSAAFARAGDAGGRLALPAGDRPVRPSGRRSRPSSTGRSAVSLGSSFVPGDAGGSQNLPGLVVMQSRRLSAARPID